MPTIRYVRGADIDREAWDRSIEGASNGLIYAYSWYLDAMASNWDGLIMGTYEAVMPLPWRKKWGIHYLYQPFLTAQLGVFGSDVGPELLEAFLEAIPASFQLWEIPLNRGNYFQLDRFGLYARVNYVLPLQHPYETMQRNYRENIRRNVRKSEQYGCVVRTGVDVNAVLQLSKEQNRSWSDGEANRFAALAVHLEAKKQAKTYGVYSAGGALLASAVFLFSHGRAYYLLVGNHPNGRTLGASHALIDAFIRDHAGSELLLDFEGSDLRNIAFFYSSFGAVEERYMAVRYERLPFYVRWGRAFLRRKT